MGIKDTVLNDIEQGKGLRPITPQISNGISGIVTENRGEKSGVRFEHFQLQGEPSTESKP